MDKQPRLLSKDAFKIIAKTEKLKLRGQPSKLYHIDNDMSYEDFFRDFLLPNRPCVFGCHVTKDWKSCKEWVAPDGMPDFNALIEQFGDVTVPVADCASKQYDAQTKEDMILRDYIAYWKTLIASQYNTNMKCLYLKDWHFNRTCKDYKAYTTPTYFTSDWLNEFWDDRADPSDDYRFVYMGPKGSWTPFHADVFRSYSWSANICGRKKWLLFPPGQEQHLKDCHGNMAYDVTSSEMHDRKKYPDYHKLEGVTEVIQEAGEAIFVPSGWFHQVFNLEDTISINHNWINGCNIDISWRFLQTELRQVEEAISDCREMDGWNEQCQLILRANSGMDFADFFTLLNTVAKQRMKNLSLVVGTGSELDSASEMDSTPEINYHDVFDLMQISELLQEMTQELSEDFQTLKKDLRTLHSVITEFLNGDLAKYL